MKRVFDQGWNITGIGTEELIDWWKPWRREWLSVDLASEAGKSDAAVGIARLEAREQAEEYERAFRAMAKQAAEAMAAKDQRITQLEQDVAELKDVTEELLGLLRDSSNDRGHQI